MGLSFQRRIWAIPLFRYFISVKVTLKLSSKSSLNKKKEENRKGRIRKRVMGEHSKWGNIQNGLIRLSKRRSIKYDGNINCTIMAVWVISWGLESYSKYCKSLFQLWSALGSGSGSGSGSEDGSGSWEDLADLLWLHFIQVVSADLVKAAKFGLNSTADRSKAPDISPTGTPWAGRPWSSNRSDTRRVLRRRRKVDGDAIICTFQEITSLEKTFYRE